MTIEDDAPLLPAWLEAELPFRRRVARVREKRIHFIDEGAGLPVLLMHGNPTWCFLWRKVIARLRSEPGLRLIAPDLLGFGLSDKPKDPSAHQLMMHIEVIASFTDVLGLDRAIVVGQDWGGPIGVGAAMQRSERTPGFLRGLVLANTGVLSPRRPVRSTAFHRFSHAPLISDLAFRVLGFPVPVLDRVQGDRRSIGSLEKRAYEYPFARIEDRAAPLGAARMVPDREAHPSTAIFDRLGAFVSQLEGPVSLVWGERDPILGRGLQRHIATFPHAEVTRTQAGHFLQEEVPDELAKAIVSVARRAG